MDWKWAIVSIVISLSAVLAAALWGYTVGYAAAFDEHAAGIDHFDDWMLG